MSSETPSSHEEQEPIVVRDKRRIDPESGEVRPPSEVDTDGASSEQAAEDFTSPLVAQLEERTEDLLRLKAEFDNYRKRVERDRLLASELGTARALASLLPTLDDISRAREHGELEGPFRQVAESLEKAVTALGLEAFGEAGDVFDPTRHDALMHSYSANVTVATATAVMARGYLFADKVLRPAQVAVTEPEETSAPDAAAPAAGSPSDPDSE